MSVPACSQECKVDFFNEVKSRYEKIDSSRFNAFIQILDQFGQNFLAKNPTGNPELTKQMDQDLRLEIATLFQDKTDLIIKFDDFIKAQRLEARASDKYAPAISLDEHVKLRFADQPAKLAEFNALFIEASKQMIENPGSGKISSIWEEMYGRIATVLAGEEDLMEDFEAFYKQIQDLGAKA